MADVPQISTAPEPITMMQTPQISGPGLGKSLMEGAQGLGDFLVEAAGAALGKAVSGAISLAGKAATAGASLVNNVTSMAAAPFQPDFSPSSSPSMAQGHSRDGHSLSQERQISAQPSYAMLGELPSPSTPSQGISASASRSV